MLSAVGNVVHQIQEVSCLCVSRLQRSIQMIPTVCSTCDACACVAVQVTGIGTGDSDKQQDKDIHQEVDQAPAGETHSHMSCACDCALHQLAASAEMF
jgi:hypothetical protein